MQDLFKTYSNHRALKVLKWLLAMNFYGILSRHVLGEEYLILSRFWIRSQTRQFSPVNFDFLIHELEMPEGQTEKSVLKYLSSFYLEDSPKEELDNYLREDFKRFLYTLSIIPKASGKLL